MRRILHPIKSQPIILLDVDGVINFTGSGGAWERQKGKIRSATVCNYHVKWSVDVISAINSWGKNLADIRWLTTWNDDARLKLAPALEINDFPLARNPNITNKAEAAFITEQNHPGVPICWLDDDLRYFNFESNVGKIDITYWKSRPNTLLIAPKLSDGLQPNDLVNIESFLLEHSKLYPRNI